MSGRAGRQSPRLAEPAESHGLSAATSAALVALAESHGLSAATSAALVALLEALDGDPFAPTSVRDPAAAVDVHLADSLVALELAPVRAARVAADLGAGAGFPGLALAAALPATRFTEVESAQRKADFITRAAAVTALGNVEVVRSRAEEWQAGMGANDLVCARALAALPVVLEYAAPLLELGGALVAWRGRRDRGEEAAARAAASDLGLEQAEVRRVRPYSTARDRHLHVFVKVAATPDRFPRRAGVAAKRPLGAGIPAPSDRLPR